MEDHDALRAAALRAMTTGELIDELGAGWGNGDSVCEEAAARLQYLTGEAHLEKLWTAVMEAEIVSGAWHRTAWQDLPDHIREDFRKAVASAQSAPRS